MQSLHTIAPVFEKQYPPGGLANPRHFPQCCGLVKV